MMKKELLTMLTFLFLIGFSCKQKTGQETLKQAPVPVSGNDIEVYYFHMTVRCATCLAIEAEARKNVEMLYPEEFNSGKITFTALNIDEETGKAVGSQYGINGQTLLIVKGDKQVNITRDAFLYAEGKPDKFATVIKTNIDSMLVK